MKQYMFGAFIGAIIGYVTNWIAIRMLFRPLVAWHVLGIRVPFTPGVIPKEKNRLASSIGDVVSEHLLTGNYVSRQLLSPRVEAQLRSFIRLKLNNAGEKSICEVLNDAGIDSQVRERCLGGAVDWAFKVCQNERIQSFLAVYATEVIFNILRMQPADLLKCRGFLEFKGFLEKSAVQFMERAENRERLKLFIVDKLEQLEENTKTIGECLPETVVHNLREHVSKMGPRIVAYVQNYLDSMETKELLIKRIDTFFEESFVHRLLGGIIGKVGGNSDRMADKIVNEMTRVFAESENQELIVKKVETLLKDILNKRICDLFAMIEADKREESIFELAGWLSHRVCSRDIFTQLFHAAEKVLLNSPLTWGQAIGIDDRDDSKQKMEDCLKRYINDIAARPDFKTGLHTFASNLASIVYDASVTGLTTTSPDRLEIIEDKIMVFYREFVKRYLPSILNFMDFRQLVRSRVDGLDVLEVEELMLGIARKELVAITWLGGILGAVIGVVMIFIQGFL